MSAHLKAQHLDFAGGETLSRTLLWAPQQKGTSLQPIHPRSHLQQNKPGLQILSPKLFQVNQSFKGYFISQQFLMPLCVSAGIQGEISHGWTSQCCRTPCTSLGGGGGTGGHQRTSCAGLLEETVTSFYSQKILSQQAKSALQLLLLTEADKGLQDTPG